MPKKPYLDVFSGMLIEDRAEEITVQGVETYPELLHKPSINGVTLSGDKTSDELYLAPASLVDTVQSHYDELTLDINDLAGAVEDNFSLSQRNLQEAIGDLEEMLEGDIADVESQLTDKANKNLSNVTGGYDWVTTSNSTSKYRLWRNKRLECENIATSVANSAGGEVILPMAYKDMNYTIQITVRQFGNYYIACEPLGVQKFRVRISDQWSTPQAIKFSWKTEGYIS